MDKLDQIKQKIEELQAKSAAKKEIKIFTALMLTLVKKTKEDFNSLSSEKVQDIQKALNEALGYIQEEANNSLDTFKQENSKAKQDIEAKLEEANSFLKEVKNIKVIKPKDGKDADEEKIVEEVLSKIQLPEYKEVVLDDGEKIVEKINELPIDDDELKIDATHIKNLPKMVQNQVGGVVARNIYQMGDVVLSNLTDGQVLTWDGTNNRWNNENGGGAGISDGDKGDITVSGSGANWTIDNGVVSLVKQADVATSTVFYRKTAGSGSPEVQTLATLKTDLGLTGTNSGDQTTIVGITGTKAQFDTAVTDGNITYVGDAVTGLTGGNWKVFYTNGSGVITELALGADGTFLKSNGATLAPSFATPAGSGDVSKVGTPVNNQIGVWTGDGTLEGDTALTFDTTTDTLATGIVTVTDDAYAAGWNGSTAVPTKNAVYDKIESMGGGVTEAFVIAMATAL
jgi:hypothetical protein